MHVLLHSVLPTLQPATTDPCLCWSLLDTSSKSGSLSFGVTVAFSWVLVHISFCLCLPYESISQPCVSPGSSTVWLMATSSKRAHAIPKSAAPRAPAPVAVPADPYLHRRHSTQFCLSLCGILVSWCAQGLFEPPERL